MKILSRHLWIIVAAAAVRLGATRKLLHEQMEIDVLSLAREAESLFANKEYNLALISGCNRTLYDHCVSEFPSPECQVSGNDGVADNQCYGHVRDRSTSVVRMPSNSRNEFGETRDLSIIQTLCLTRELDKWFVDRDWKFNQNYYSYGSSRPRAAYFGSVDGSFRIFPARFSQNCGTYDPRLRPWFVAGSSGKKNVVIIVDNAMSVTEDLLDKARNIVLKSILPTLGWEDRVGFVTTSSTSLSPAVHRMSSNKEQVSVALERLEGSHEAGDMSAAFERAFQMLNTSYIDNDYVPCHTAMIIITPGDSSSHGNERSHQITKITNLVQTWEAQTGTAVIPFSISSSGDGDSSYLTELMCRSNGIWTSASGDVSEALGSYYRVFAHGLGSDSNTGFVAWTDEYVFATGGMKGVTVSTPVYDRSIDPPRFVGVAAIDITMENLASSESHGLTSPNSPNCPNFDFISTRQQFIRDDGSSKGECMLESIRPENARCGGCKKGTMLGDDLIISDTDLGGFRLMENFALKGVSYSKRSCCATTGKDSCYGDQCSNSTRSSVRIVFVILVCCCLIGFCLFWYKTNNSRVSVGVPSPTRTGVHNKPVQNFTTSSPSLPKSHGGHSKDLTCGESSEGSIRLEEPTSEEFLHEFTDQGARMEEKIRNTEEQS